MISNTGLALKGGHQTNIHLGRELINNFFFFTDIGMNSDLFIQDRLLEDAKCTCNKLLKKLCKVYWNKNFSIFQPHEKLSQKKTDALLD